jgi:RNA polymerase sigma factor (sigma-70 family)
MSQEDLNKGVGAGRFPPTKRSVIAAIGSSHPEERRSAFGAIVTAYWKPVYKYLRLKWHASPEESADLTQEFFARAFEKDYFVRYDASKARFRTFLRTCLDGFVANERKAQSRIKRGGQHIFVPLDVQTAEGELRQLEHADELSLDEYFRREWVRHLFGLAVEDLRRVSSDSGRNVHFSLFERYDLDSSLTPKLTYAELGQQFGLSTTDVTNYLAWARREFRARVLDHLRDLSATDEEFEAEARALLGIHPE